MHELADQFRTYFRTLWRHRWQAMGIAWVTALCGWIAVYHLPKRYEADARVYVDTQSVLRPLLSGLAVQPNLSQTINLMSQTLISRPNLEKVVHMAGLEGRASNESERMQMVTRLNKAITIKSAGKENLYEIACVDNDPQVAKRIVESLLQLFVEKSQLDNRKDSETAQEFIDDQLKLYREKLEQAENAITRFKRNNIGLMPGDGAGYFARLDEAKAAVNKAKLDLREAENSTDSIRQRLARLSEVPTGDDPATGTIVNPPSELDLRIAALQQKLDALRLSYTEEHPDIIASARMLEQLKGQKQAEEIREMARTAQKDSKGERPATASQAKNPLFQQLTIALASSESNVAVMRTRLNEYANRYAELQAAAGAMPKVEAEYVSLTRDYELNKARYAELIKRRDSAQLSRDMETSDAAMTFQVIDPPRVVPIMPNPLLLATAVLIGALVVGAFGAVLFSQIKPTIGTESRLSEVSGLKVLGTVVMMRNETQARQRKRGLFAFGASGAALFASYAVIIAAIMMTTVRV